VIEYSAGELIEAAYQAERAVCNILVSSRTIGVREGKPVSVGNIDKLNFKEDAELLEPFLRPFYRLRELALKVDSGDCVGRIDELLRGEDVVDRPLEMSGNEIAHDMQEAIKSFFMKATAKNLLYLEAAEAELYRGTTRTLFGDEVADRFGSASFDLEEAAKALALNLGTSCVFHLMRAMEVPLRSLWQTTGNVSVHPKNWTDFINQIASYAKVPPNPQPLDWPERKLFYIEAIDRIRDVKDRWRNPTMHEITQKYNVSEAKDIKEAIRLLLRILAKHIDEQGNWL
jgi:hypothetical protein